MKEADNSASARAQAMAEAEELLCGDAHAMAAPEAEKTLRRLEEVYDVLAQFEPEDEESEETLEWEALLEDMDDMMDEIRDRLDGE